MNKIEVNGLNFGRAPLKTKKGKEYCPNLDENVLVENEFFTWPLKKPGNYAAFAEEVWDKMKKFTGGQMFCIAGKHVALGPVANRDEAVDFVIDDLITVFGKEADGKLF